MQYIIRTSELHQYYANLFRIYSVKFLFTFHALACIEAQTAETSKE
jgi:hypothetical protein